MDAVLKRYVGHTSYFNFRSVKLLSLPTATMPLIPQLGELDNRYSAIPLNTILLSYRLAH